MEEGGEDEYKDGIHILVQFAVLPAVMEETELCFQQLFNTSCMRPRRPHFEIMLTYILLSFISLLTVILNLLVIISVSHFR